MLHNAMYSEKLESSYLLLGTLYFPVLLFLICKMGIKILSHLSEDLVKINDTLKDFLTYGNGRFRKPLEENNLDFISKPEWSTVNKG